ncbi:hypothetical protein LCGC14_2919480, partial [marine sediment metagenome]
QLVINGEKLNYDPVSETAINRVEIENLHGIKHAVELSKQRSAMQNFAPVIIPENMYLAMGDNRDNSADSRVIGLVPRAELLGRAKRVIVSLDYDDYYLPRKDRVLKAL